jgi:hypothetical protein
MEWVQGAQHFMPTKYCCQRKNKLTLATGPDKQSTANVDSKQPSRVFRERMGLITIDLLSAVCCLLSAVYCLLLTRFIPPSRHNLAASQARKFPTSV